MGKPYMPLMMGDWIRGTRGMKANVKGVYIGLLIHQYDNGFIPDDMETLSLIEPEVGSVWVSLKSKFEQFEPGKLRNPKLEEVRAFWSKQSKNGSKGGRPSKENPNGNPDTNPKANPNHNHHIDIDYDLDNKLKGAFDEIYLGNIRGSWGHLDFEFEVSSFIQKVKGSPGKYKDRDTDGLRLALQSQLRYARPKPKEKPGNELSETETLKRIKNKPQENGIKSSPGGTLD